MTNPIPLCSCPFSYDDNRQLVRVALDSACKVHANRKQTDTKHCPTCTCGVEVVQTVEVAREMVRKGESDDAV